MKKCLLPLLTLAFFLTMHSTFAQFSRPLSIGVGAGGTYSLADLGNGDINFAGHVDVDYLITSFISAGIHGEKGKLSAWGYESDYKNNYFVVNGNAKLRIGQFFSLPNNYSQYTLGTDIFHKILANIYLGAGVGFMKNNINQHISNNYGQSVIDNGGELSRELTSLQLVVPLNIGVDIPMGRTLYGPSWAINLNYQQTLAPNDNIDGIINNANDQYSYFSLGVKLALF